MVEVVADDGVPLKNGAVLDLQNELAGLSIVFTANAYAVRVDDGNPWIEMFSASVAWPSVAATPATWTQIEV